MNKGRVEAITDGIIAIAATIMVLELKLPTSNKLDEFISLRHTFIAYVISFVMIYIVWSMHHALFKKAKVISQRTFLVNGFWIFILTLVPFNTAWVGASPDALLPEVVYPINMILWRAAFHWLSYRVMKDNPDAVKDEPVALWKRLFMYAGYLLCIGLAFIKPVFSMYTIAFLTVIMLLWTFNGDKIKEVKREQ